MQDLTPIRCVFHRGGTSRGLFFHRSDLPARSRWDEVFMAAMGAPDIRQIDGLGGATSHTSKAVVISPSEEPDADVDYLFAQVGIADAIVDYKGMCGNLLTAVGPFAVDEGLVEPKEPLTTVSVYNVNTRKFFAVHVPVRNAKSLNQGDYAIYGVPGTGAKYKVDYLNPTGAFSGKLFPTGNVTDILEIEGMQNLEVTILDVTNPMVFVRAKDLNIQDLGNEDPRTTSPERLLLLERIRCQACYVAGFVDDPEKVTNNLPAVPRLALVQPPTEAVTLEGRALRPEDMNLYSHMLSMQKVHQSYAGTGSVCLAAAACTPGTIVHQAMTGSRESEKTGVQTGTIRFGHPSGLMEVSVEADEKGRLKHVSMGRTARRLMDGHVYVPARLLESNIR